MTRAFEPTDAPRSGSVLSSAHFRAVFAVALFIMFGFGLILPTLPRFARELGASLAQVGLLATVFNGTRLVSNVFTGPLLDRLGDRVVTGTGAAIVGVSSIAAGAAPTLGWLIVLRGIGGVGSALFLGGLMAHLVGAVPQEERGRAMGLFQGVLGIGFILGPIFGGIIAAVASLNTPLYVYGAICLVSAPLTLRAMAANVHASEGLEQAPDFPEEPAPPSPPAWRRIRPLLGDSAYRAALATTGAGFLSTSAVGALLPIMWEESLGGTDASVGIPFTVQAVASLVVLWHAGGLSDRRGRRFAVIPALAVAAVVTSLAGYVGDRWTLVLLMAVLGVAGGYTRPAPTAMVADVATPETRAVAVSGYRTAGDLGAFVGPLLAGALAEAFGTGPAFLAAGISLVLALALVVAARETAPSRRAPAAAPAAGEEPAPRTSAG